MRTKHGREVPIKLVREVEGAALTVVVAVPTTAGTAWMEIDCGNGGANVMRQTPRNVDEVGARQKNHSRRTL